jgi:type II secretory pathway pseudopilin PulG
VSVSLVLAVLLLAVIAAAVIRTERLRDIREARREAERRERQEAERLAIAQARHPSRRQVLRRMVPGLCPDGEPLNEKPFGEAERLAALEFMIRHVSIPEPEQENQARDSAEEGTE